MKIKEIQTRAENLIEVGREAEEKRDRALVKVQDARQNAIRAQIVLSEASETDQDGKPVGDVDTARALLDAAVDDLEEREAELEQAEAELKALNEQKYETIETLEEYTEGEKGNLSIVKQLQEKLFGGNVGAMVASIIGQLNVAEATRNALLNSLGLSGQSSSYSQGGTNVNQILSTPVLKGDAKQQCIGLLRSRKGSFSAENWSRLSFRERATALRGLAVDAGNAMGIEIKGVEFYNGKRKSRGYYSGDGYLYLNSDVLYDESQREDALDTIFHEGRHAFQREAMNDPKKYGISESTAKAWRNNQPPNYIRYEEDPKAYRSQPVEKDAFSFAGNVIKGGLN